MHRFKGAELQTENLAKFLVIINLEWIWKHNRQREKIVKSFYLFYFLSMAGDLKKMREKELGKTAKKKKKNQKKFTLPVPRVALSGLLYAGVQTDCRPGASW